MKQHVLSCVVFFMLCLCVTAQTPTENYIKRTIYTAPSTQGITENDTLVTVTYFDGLGRPKQTVTVRGGGNALDHNLLPWKDDWTLGSGSTPFLVRMGIPPKTKESWIPIPLATRPCSGNVVMSPMTMPTGAGIPTIFL